MVAETREEEEEKEDETFKMLCVQFISTQLTPAMP